MLPAHALGRYAAPAGGLGKGGETGMGVQAQRAAR